MMSYHLGIKIELGDRAKELEKAAIVFSIWLDINFATLRIEIMKFYLPN